MADTKQDTAKNPTAIRLAQILFAAYNADSNGKTHDGKDTPTWRVICERDAARARNTDPQRETVGVVDSFEPGSVPQHWYVLAQLVLLIAGPSVYKVSSDISMSQLETMRERLAETQPGALIMDSSVEVTTAPLVPHEGGLMSAAIDRVIACVRTHAEFLFGDRHENAMAVFERFLDAV